MSDAAGTKRDRNRGVEPDGSGIVLDGAVKDSLRVVSRAPVVVSVGIRGIEPDRLIIVLDGGGVLLKTLMSDAAAIEKLGQVGLRESACLNGRGAGFEG